MSSDRQTALLALFERLDEQGQCSLLDYAGFLVERHGLAEPQSGIPEPELSPRPENESVVKAMKRLSAGYFMLDRASIFHQASALMTEHIMQGRPAGEVIDDLEALFLREYQKLTESR